MKESENYLKKLFEFLAIPSISTLPEHKKDIDAAVSWLRDFLIESGFKAENIEELYAQGLDKEIQHPVLFAQRIDNPSNPTLLLYGHYDVQPADPIAEWKSDAFKPEVRDGNIYARGATDDKGQVFAHLAAIHALSQEWGDSWPVNIKVLIEGEEENGGENIAELMKENVNTSKFDSDICIVSDGGWVNMTNPTIEYGLRGITYMQIDVKLCDADLHSGLFGGGVKNPVNALCEIIAKLQDPSTGRVLIPRFYDDVEEISIDEKRNLGKLPYNEQEFLEFAKNAKSTFTEEGYTVTESTSARPTLDVNGIWGGFQGTGAKTIIPASAHAKVSMRLVANQNPQKIAELFEKYVSEIAPKEVEVSVSFLHGGNSFLVKLDSPYLKLAEDLLKEVFNEEVLYARSGGSIPLVADMQNLLGITPILINLGQPDDSLHSPNEKLALNNFYGGIEFSKKFISQLGKVKK